MANFLNINSLFYGGCAALVDSLVAKTRAWEEERGVTFTYDGVPLLAMLDEYAMLRQDREEEKKRMRVFLISLTVFVLSYNRFIKTHCLLFENQNRKNSMVSMFRCRIRKSSKNSSAKNRTRC